MIYDELAKRLKEGQWVDKEEMHMRSNALRAVVKLHKPFEQTTGISYTQENGLEVLETQAICAFCKDMGAVEHWYPCPTIQAIEKELE